MADVIRTEADYATTAEWIEAQVQDSDTHFRQWDYAIGEELDFAINQNHYDDDETNTRDRRRIKPKDPSLMAMIRHKTSLVMKASQHFEVEPVDKFTDPMQAEYWKTRLRLELTNPDNNHRENLADVVSSTFAARMWALEFVRHPDCGLISRPLDPRRLRWHSGFKSPHDKGCPWINIKDRIPLEDAIQMAKDSPDFKGNLSDITPDPALDKPVTPTQVYADEIRLRGSNGPSPGETGQRFVTVYRWYAKWDKKTYKKRRNNRRLLHAPDRYMECQECNYQSPPEHTMEQPWPAQAVCPNCGGTMERIDALDHEDEMLKYKDGRRLVICFPKCKVTIHDGAWEFEKMRNWPVVLFKAYWHPIYPVPMSDTAYYRTLQLMIDSMYRLGFEQMLKSKGWIMAPEDGLFDAFGNVWQFSDYQDVMYYRDIIAPNAIQYFQPAGLNPAWATFLGSVQGAFSAHSGTGDIGIGQNQSKDIAVGTINTLVQTGEIPVDNHVADFQVFMSRFLTRLAEGLMSVDDREMTMHILGPQGIQQASIVTSSLPMVNIIVTAEPDLSQDKLEIMQKFQQLTSLAQNPPLFQLMARLVNLPDSLVREFMRAQPQGPQNPPSSGDKIITAIAALMKAGEGLPLDVVNAALATAGLPPIQGPPPSALLLPGLQNGGGGGFGATQPQTNGNTPPQMNGTAGMSPAMSAGAA